VHLRTRSISASLCISKLSWSRLPSASCSSLDFGRQVNPQIWSIIDSKYNVKERPCVYGDSGIMEVEWATSRIYSGDPGVHRRPLIFITYSHTMNILTQSFRTVGVSHSFGD
jgi:hypothetical protein